MKLHKAKENEIYYYYLKNGDKRYMYRHKYVDVLGKRKEKKKSGFKTEKSAIRSLLEVRASLINGEVVQVENDSITVSQWLDIWYDMNKDSWKRTTIENRKIVINNLLKPLIGSYKLKTLNRSTYQKTFIDELKNRKYKPSTINTVHVIFKTAINSAI